MQKLGKVTSIKEIHDLKLTNKSDLNGSGGRLGFSQMLNSLSGYGSKEGYELTTDKHTYLMLIDDGQSCCESWGYLWSDEDTEKFMGKELVEVKLTDMALNTRIQNAEKEMYEGGIKFIDFKFSDGDVLQFAVYNSHNGYYGHDIIFAKDNEIILNDVI